MGLLASYVVTKYDVLLSALEFQLYLVMLSSLITIAVGVSAGILMTRFPGMAGPILKIASTLYTIPILAMFALLIPLFGIGELPAIIALVIYGLLPILHNTYAGIKCIDPSIVEAAQGMGASEWQLLKRVEIPLALPKIVAGIRTSVVMNISVATFAVFIGAGGLGTIILQGIRTFHEGMLIAGTILVALVAVIFERLLNWLENRVKIIILR
ncbi:MAG: opuCB1 [Firmicutes bacterium]|nr:opuCB1 [Bacillota bacterium]